MRNSHFITGIQALVHLPIVQHKRDIEQGLRTAGFISGYRGSPLAGYDKALWSQKNILHSHDIIFSPGINEDLAATAVWGSQQSDSNSQYDGVFSIWYGKGPGVDRSMDVFKHAQAAGTHPKGGVLAIAGDDHFCKSSTLPHQSDYAFMDANIPVLAPASVADIIPLGLYGFALSRYSGSWVGFKIIADLADGGMAMETITPSLTINIPHDKRDVHIRWPDTPIAQESRLYHEKYSAILAFATANELNPFVITSPKPTLTIVAVGKAIQDVYAAFTLLGIDDPAMLGIQLMKVAMPWPFDVKTLPTNTPLFVVEEKRPLVEDQIRRTLYGKSHMPIIFGKSDAKNTPLLPTHLGFTAATVASALTRVFKEIGIPHTPYLPRETSPNPIKTRSPFFCSGCPHNRSTNVPEGSRALGGIGCHYMATWIQPRTSTFTHMGGEGATWIGQSPFTTTPHVFANLGDGTYFHSGLMAIRASVSANVNITYKILYNDAVAMTGGQPFDGSLSVQDISWQLHAEGITHITVLSSTPDSYDPKKPFAPHVHIGHRDELDEVQRRYKKIKGTSVIIYDQICATEKKRKQKRGQLPPSQERIFINEEVCEGCGDCSKASNCLSVIPKNTSKGVKRAIDQYSCTQDYSCIKGFCPSFVSVINGKLKTPKFSPEDVGHDLPAPQKPESKPYHIFIAGVGGTGIVTLSSLLGTAAAQEGLYVQCVDMTGLSQKGGSVYGHITLSPAPVPYSHIPDGKAHLILGNDLIVSTQKESLIKAHKEHTHVVVNTHNSPTETFVQKGDSSFPKETMLTLLRETTHNVLDINAHEHIHRSLGNPLYVNLFLLGYAYQKGLIPLSHKSIEKTIMDSGIKVDHNLYAFRLGREKAHKNTRTKPQKPFSLDDKIAENYTFLTEYQNTKYADTYLSVVRHVEKADIDPDKRLSHSVVYNLCRAMAYKDEYEVARLYTNGTFMQSLHKTFEKGFRLKFHLAPPLFSPKDPLTGHLKKRSFGPWMLKVFSWLAKGKVLRGTIFDIFGYTQERRFEKQFIKNYIQLLRDISLNLTEKNYEPALNLSTLPEIVKGFGHIKEENAKKAATLEKEWRQKFFDLSR